MHAGTVVHEQRLGHEGRDFAVFAGDVLYDVLVPEDIVRHLRQACESHVDLVLAGGGYLMVVHLDWDSHFLHLDDHFAANVLERVVRWDREVAFLVTRLVAEVGLSVAAGVPLTFD